MFAIRLDRLKKAVTAPTSQMSESLRPCRRSSSKSPASMAAELSVTLTAKSTMARWRGVSSAWR